MTRRELITSNEYIEATTEVIIVSGKSVKEMRKEMNDFFIGLRDELLEVRGDAIEEEKEHDPYWYWPQCDVDGCEGVSGYNGMGWRETGYWCLCSKHANDFRAGKPQPKMKDSAIAKEKTRLPDGTLPLPEPPQSK